MVDTAEATGAAADASVDLTRVAEEANLAEEKNKEIAAAQRLVEAAKAHLKGAEQALADAKKGMN